MDPTSALLQPIELPLIVVLALLAFTPRGLLRAVEVVRCGGLPIGHGGRQHSPPNDTGSPGGENDAN